MDNLSTTSTAASSAAEASTGQPQPILALTPVAVEQVKAVMAEQKLPDAYLVVRVVPAGCSGLGYDVNLLAELKPGDVSWEQDGVRVATDPMSQKLLAGTTLDFVKTETSAGFRFNNPNAKSSCGCGSSFSA